MIGLQYSSLEVVWYMRRVSEIFLRPSEICYRSLLSSVPEQYPCFRETHTSNLVLYVAGIFCDLRRFDRQVLALYFIKTKDDSLAIHPLQSTTSTAAINLHLSSCSNENGSS
jgi:hypothetical protein